MDKHQVTEFLQFLDARHYVYYDVSHETEKVGKNGRKFDDEYGGSEEGWRCMTMPFTDRGGPMIDEQEFLLFELEVRVMRARRRRIGLMRGAKSRSRMLW